MAKTIKKQIDMTEKTIKMSDMTKNLKWVIKPQKTSEEYEVPKNLIFH